MRPWSVLLFGLCLPFSLPGFAQQNTQPTPSTEASAAATPVNNRRISLDVVVTDKSGKVIPGLQQEDFKLVDNKQPQPILSFQAVAGTAQTAAPPQQQVILLVDAANTGYQSVLFERQQLQKLLQQNGGRLPLPMSLVFLTDTSTEIQPVTTNNGNALLQTLDANQTGLRSITRSQGFYGGEERVQLSIAALQKLASYEETQPGRKLLIWLSPGWPLLSGPGVELSNKARQWIFKVIVSLSAALRESRVTVYSIDPLGLADAGTGRTDYYKTFLKGVASVNRVEGGNLALGVIAIQTGGQVLNSSNDLVGLISTCLEDTKAFYTISFDSPPADGPDEYHSLQIKLDKPGLSARTRTGYYAQQ